jgi:hypothetical protein
VQAHWFGVTPPTTLLVVALLVLAAAVGLFAIGLWPAGLIVAGVGVLLVTAFVETARRRPAGPLLYWSARVFDRAKANAALLVEALAARGHAGREATRIRLELRRLQSQRRDLLAAFGDAIYHGADATHLRARLEELDANAQRLDRELDDVAVSARERIRNARIAVQQTEMVTTPEPYPPPDEGDLPGPVITPEPLPPPDEGTPPQPDPVPTPGPEPSPAESSLRD